MVDTTKSILFHNVRLIDCISDNSLEGYDVLVNNQHIIKVDKKITPPENSCVYNLEGKTILPGLIDAHVHLVFDASVDAISNIVAEIIEHKSITLLKAAKNAECHLDHGVTTVRDLGGPIDILNQLKQAINSGLINGPRILTSGEVITITGGHCHFMGYEVDDENGARRATRQAIKNLADVIKVMATGGASTPGSKLELTQFSENEIRVIVEEAHKQDRKVATHANGLEGLRNAVKAGVDSVEHGTYADDNLLDLMAEKGTWYIPTMSPAVIILEKGHGILPELKIKGVYNRWIIRQEVISKAIQRKIPMAAGTDGGIGMNPHGNVSQEVELFSKMGLSPMEAIWTATRRAADLLGISDSVGTVVSGKLADLIVVDGNPLDDLRLLKKPSLVMKDGVIVKDRTEFDRKEIE